ncbi:ATP-binding cassette domain-containing protein [Pedobacter psychroterrae]|uniref:ATP-binding cassette domain-containing protein n=1 Tax=Pedobacter psychroterrae TaxID=2530453 RepID=A0A4V2MK98_9SPHI|nr:ATP-binding cassette domain-containing protein [Pedobacter psychroterrae]TCC97406.1 ATP-binding cassette domain-containing protein [Pedobacter psychroterrae]
MIHKLEVDSVVLDFGPRRVLSDVYMKFETGKVTGLLGKNGNGKTCLMKIIYGQLQPNSKSIRFDESHVAELYKRPDLLLYLPQFNFIPAGLSLKRIFSDFSLDFQVFEKFFPEFNSKYTTTLKTLSGGQRRIIEIYMVLMSNSKFAMLDEPFSHQSPLVIEKITELINQAKNNKGILVTDHMYQTIIEISDHLYLLANGKTHLTKCVEDLKFLGYV